MIQPIQAMRQNSFPGIQPAGPAAQDEAPGRTPAAAVAPAPTFEPIGPAPLMPPAEALQRTVNRTVPTSYQSAVSAGSSEWPVINAIVANVLGGASAGPSRAAVASPPPHLVAGVYARYSR